MLLCKKIESPIDSDFQNGKINDKQEFINFDDIDKARDFAQQQGMLPPLQDTQENSTGPAEQTISCAIIFILHGIKLTLTFFFSCRQSTTISSVLYLVTLGLAV